jgi:hypothetical protein
MADVKVGARLKSAVCETQIMVLKAPPGSALTCGGAPMIGANEAGAGALDPAHAEGTEMGKRYVNGADTLEVLCVKGGKGGLAWNGEKLGPKQAKALPSSD